MSQALTYSSQPAASGSWPTLQRARSSVSKTASPEAWKSRSYSCAKLCLVIVALVASAQAASYLGQSDQWMACLLQASGPDWPPSRPDQSLKKRFARPLGVESTVSEPPVEMVPSTDS